MQIDDLYLFLHQSSLSLYRQTNSGKNITFLAEVMTSYMLIAESLSTFTLAEIISRIITNKTSLAFANLYCFGSCNFPSSHPQTKASENHALNSMTEGAWQWQLFCLIQSIRLLASEWFEPAQHCDTLAQLTNDTLTLFYAAWSNVHEIYCIVFVPAVCCLCAFVFAEPWGFRQLCDYNCEWGWSKWCRHFQPVGEIFLHSVRSWTSSGKIIKKTRKQS